MSALLTLAGVYRKFSWGLCVLLAFTGWCRHSGHPEWACVEAIPVLVCLWCMRARGHAREVEAEQVVALIAVSRRLRERGDGRRR